MHDHDRRAGQHDAGRDRQEHPTLAPGGPGHNRPAAQWQTPHLPDGAAAGEPPEVRDLDLLETSFVEGFGRASDPTSFLRLAGIPFVGVDRAGCRLHLLRVELEDLTDVGAVSPLLGGQGVRYDPLPSQMVARRQRLAFVYHDGRQMVRLAFTEARALIDESAGARFELASTERS
jgi:hypothetical protein